MPKTSSGKQRCRAQLCLWEEGTGSVWKDKTGGTHLTLQDQGLGNVSMKGKAGAKKEVETIRFAKTAASSLIHAWQFCLMSESKCLKTPSSIWILRLHQTRYLPLVPVCLAVLPQSTRLHLSSVTFPSPLVCGGTTSKQTKRFLNTRTSVLLQSI